MRRGLEGSLRKSGYAVDSAGDGEEGLWLAETNDYDVVILDIMLPKLDGVSVLQQLRKKGRDLHVLLLTAKDTVQDRVNGLRAGADDYLVKPFALEELLARIEALCRRAYGRKDAVITVGDLTIDTAAKSAGRSGKPLDLTPHEFALLEYMARRQGVVVSRTEIEAHIYDDARSPISNVVDAAVCNLRKKIGGTAVTPLIRTRRGFGYMLTAGRPGQP